MARWLALMGPLFMLSVLPAISDWLKNRDQVTVVDLGVPVVLCLILSAGITAVFFRSFLHNRFAALLFGVGVLLLLGQYYPQTLFKIVDKLIHRRWGNWQVLAFFVVAIIITAVVYRLFDKFTRRWQTKTNALATAGSIVISVAFLIQFFTLARVVIIEWPQFFYRPPALTMALAAKPANTKPDIYYIILDRYVSQDVLTNQFNFDNSPFTNWLTTNGFTVKPDAYSNYPFTAMSVASTLSANYLSDQVHKFGTAVYQTMQPYYDTIHYAPAIRQVKSLGYSYYHLGTWYEATSTAPLADHYYQPDGQLTVLNHRFTLSNTMRIMLINSVYQLFVQRDITVNNFTIINFTQQDARAATLYKFDVLKKITNAQPGGRFIFAHFLVPHYPYYFNADGTRAADPKINNNGKKIKQKYTDQLQFVNSQIKLIVETINQKSDGQAIIILQSDEGEYPMYLNDEQFWLGAEKMLFAFDMRTWSDVNLKMKYGILAAYHVPQATTQALTDGGDPVNIFRLIFNTYFGGQLSYLPKCYYTYPHGRGNPFVYSNINDRLTGQTNPACSSDSR